MWSVFNLALPVANAIYTASYVLVVLGAVLTLSGSIGLFWSGGIREKYAEERISSNELAVARANAEAAKAQLEAAKLKQAASWRRLNPAQHKILVERLRGRLSEGVWVETVGADPESMQLHEDIVRAFKEAGIEVSVFYGWEVAVGVGIVNGPEASKQVLRDAFREIGVVLYEKKEGLIKDKVKAAEKVELIIGTKPPPEFQR